MKHPRECFEMHCSGVKKTHNIGDPECDFRYLGNDYEQITYKSEPARPGQYKPKRKEGDE